MQSRLIIGVGILALLTGCSFADSPEAKSTTGRAPTVAEVPSADETVRGAEEPPIVTLDVKGQLHERKLSRSEPLPSGIIIPNTNLSAVPVTAALQAVLSGSDVSLSWDADVFADRLVSVSNLSGSLSSVVEKICASAKVFCSYRGGLLELKDKETFIVELPAVPSLKAVTKGSANSMADMITALSGDKVKIDQQGGNLVYTTDVEGQENVRLYLKELRHGRPLVVMQLYIWEVKLSKDHATGINWTNFSMPDFRLGDQSLSLGSLTTAFSSIATPGVSLGATLRGRVSADGVLKFLLTQGQVQTISNPQLTFVSGSNAEFRVGGKQRYISEIGELTSSVSSSSSSLGTNTISTDEIETGLTVTVGGAYESGVISALMELAMEDVISLNPTTMDNGTIVDLPETSERKVSTSLRVRPGDNLVLAGLVSSRDTNDREGMPLPFGASLTSYYNDEFENTELVILVKPSIVQFKDSSDEDDAAFKKHKDHVSIEMLPDPVLIDKDGMQSVSMTAFASSAEPALQEKLPQELFTTSIPVAPSTDAAPVDKRLLQRGFSYAYDQMLAPVPEANDNQDGGQ